MVSRDYPFEALAEVTGTDWTAGRGELNAALKSIRDQSETEDSYLLADEIHARAKLYRQVMPEVMLTPSALAKHWKRVAAVPKVRGSNLHAGHAKPFPPSRREENLAEAQKILAMLKGET